MFGFEIRLQNVEQSSAILCSSACDGAKEGPCERTCIFVHRGRHHTLLSRLHTVGLSFEPILTTITGRILFPQLDTCCNILILHAHTTLSR